MSRSAKVLISATVMVALSALLAGTVVAKPSGLGPGNSPNAKLCHKGGWENLVDADGNGFASEQACVAYAAKGGVPQPKPEGEADLTLSPGEDQGDQYRFIIDSRFGSATQQFTVTNQGTGSSNQLDVSGGGPDIVLSNDTCSGLVLAVNASCTFDVTATAPASCSGTFFGFALVHVWDSLSHAIQLEVWGECPLS